MGCGALNALRLVPPVRLVVLAAAGRCSHKASVCMTLCTGSIVRLKYMCIHKRATAPMHGCINRLFHESNMVLF